MPADAPSGSAPPGLDDVPVETVPIGAISAVVSRLPADVYSGSAFDEALGDLAWVAERGVGHERVVAWFVDHAEIVPAPLFTLFSSVSALDADVRVRAEEIGAVIARFTGLREWDVKIGYDAATLEAHAGEVSEAVHAIDAEMEDAAPGRRFLLERKRADIVKREVGVAARRLAHEAYAELSAAAQDAVLLPLPQGTGDLPVVLNAALLVGRTDERALIARLEERAATLRPLGVELRFSGPWAAYRFMGDARE